MMNFLRVLFGVEVKPQISSEIRGKLQEYPDRQKPQSEVWDMNYFNFLFGDIPEVEFISTGSTGIVYGEHMY